MPLDQDTVERIFIEAHGMPSGSERAAYLERAILFGRKVAWRSRPLEARASSSIAAPSTKEESHA